MYLTDDGRGKRCLRGVLFHNKRLRRSALDDAEWELLLHLFIVRAEREILCNARVREGSEKRSILQAVPHEQNCWMRRVVNKNSELASASRKSRVSKLAAVHPNRNSTRRVGLLLKTCPIIRSHESL